jgi:hypothetical protein
VIKKPSIIITSLGRTGTRFFYTFFKEIVPESTSLHEPDVFQIVLPQHTSSSNWFKETLKRIHKRRKEVGFSNLIVRKALGKWSLIELSDARVRGELGYDTALQQILLQRSNFVNSRSGSVYIESNRAYYGIIDVLKDAYQQHKLAYIIRDPREWIRSEINWGEKYGKGKIRSLITHTWPRASEIEGDPYREKWTSMSRFEKMCWAWTKLNGYALRTIEQNPNACWFHFEEIFESDSRYTHLADLVDFATAMPGFKPVSPQTLEGWLDKQIHKSSKDFPSWSNWSTKHKQKLTEICGSLMKELGYY